MGKIIQNRIIQGLIIYNNHDKIMEKNIWNDQNLQLKDNENANSIIFGKAA